MVIWCDVMKDGWFYKKKSREEREWKRVESMKRESEEKGEGQKKGKGRSVML